MTHALAHGPIIEDMARVEDRFEQRALQVVVKALFVMLAVVEAMDVLDATRQRASRRLTSWWADVERRQRMELRRAQAGLRAAPR